MLSEHAGCIDRRIVAEANALAESGRAVTLLSVPAEIPGDCLDPRVRVIMPPAGHARGPAARLRDKLRRLAPGLHESLRSLCFGLGLGPIDRLTGFFLANAPTEVFHVVHAHDLPALPAALALKERLPGARVIFDAHELFPFQFTDARLERYWSRIENACIRRADAVVTVNDALAGELAGRYGLPTPTVVHNSYGVGACPPPLSPEAFAAHFGAGDRAFTVLYQGNLSPGRNLENLVRAFGRLDDDTRLFLLGDGPLEPALRTLAGREGGGRVFFGRRVPQAVLLAYTACADLGIIPYLPAACLNTRLCTPNKLYEFIEAGVPICASDLPELRRIVTTHRIGDVFCMDTPQGIASAVASCRRWIGQGGFDAACRREARAYYAWSGQARRLLDLYERLGV